MSNTVSEHYKNHLAPIYSWMVGDFENACAQAADFYEELDLPVAEKIAVDLGCGHGVHSITLARRGFRVIAIDNSPQLLAELDSLAGDLPIQIVTADLMKFKSHIDVPSVTIVVCMGDTLTHLPSFDAVQALVHDAADCLPQDGLFTVSFRDYATQKLAGSDRFIPVKSDETRIHNCFLEYGKDTVLVHDIIHSKSEADSTWKTEVSAYPKLRLAPSQLIRTAQACGLSLVHQSVDRGMLYFAFKRS